MLTDFLDWWWSALRACLPTSWRYRAYTTAPYVIIQKVGIELRHNGSVEQIDAPDAESVAQLIAGRIGTRAQAGLVIALDADRYIVRTLSAARLPRSRAKAMMSFDLAGATPFSASEVHCFLLQSDSGKRPATTYAIVKRSILDPVLDALRSARMPIERMVLLTGEKEISERALSPGDVAELNGASIWMRHGAVITMSALLLAAIGTLVHLHWSYGSTQARLEQTLPALELKAKAVREELNRRAARIEEVNTLRTNLATQRPMSEVWEELSRVLPDSAYITDLTIQGDSASMVGFSRVASTIIAPIEESPMLEGAEFASPVVKVPGQEGERFEVKLKVLSR